jgi:solute carrier family 32 (vesicular inhibitory amino acid transporter)
MRQPARFARAAGAATAVMTLAYATLGSVGYASRGARVHEIVIFALGEGPWERAAAGAVLLQALAQYLVNVNVWVHNLLVLLSRAREARKGSSGSGEAEEPLLLPLPEAGEATAARSSPRTAADHARRQWALATLFVVAYSFVISMSLPFFSSLVGLLVAGTYLAAAYALPCWFALRLLKPMGLLSPLEARWCRFLICGSAAVSCVGMAASVSALVNNIGGGPAAAA